MEFAIFPLQQCFLSFLVVKTHNEMAISDRQTDAVRVTRILPSLCLFYLADGSKTGQRPFSQRVTGIACLYSLAGNGEACAFMNHVFSLNDNPALFMPSEVCLCYRHQ